MTTAQRSRSRSSSISRRTQLNQNREFWLHGKQTALYTSTAPVRLFRGAIASGKTIAGAALSIGRRYQYPGTGQLIAGPSWDQVRDGALVTLKRMLNPDCIVYENKNEHIIELDNRSWFQLRSLSDPDVLRSLEFHDAWIDEIAMCTETALDVTLGRVRLPYQDPTFQHTVWGTTTPRGMDWTLGVFGMAGKTHDVTVRGEDGEPMLAAEGRPQIVQMRYDVSHATIFDNRAHLPAGYIERLVQKYEGTPFYEQELLGLYTAFEGLVYPMFRRETHVTGIPCALSECSWVGAGVDFGGITPTAMELLGVRASGRSHVYDEFYRNGATLPDMAVRLGEWERQRGRKLDVVACDGSEPVAIASLRAQGFNAVAADKDRDTGIKLMQQRLQPAAGGPGLTFAPECIGVIAEMGSYVWTGKRDAETKVVRLTDQPIDHHADGLDAVRYAVMASAQRRERQLVTLPSGRQVWSR